MAQSAIQSPNEFLYEDIPFTFSSSANQMGEKNVTSLIPTKNGYSVYGIQLIECNYSPMMTNVYKNGSNYWLSFLSLNALTNAQVKCRVTYIRN